MWVTLLLVGALIIVTGIIPGMVVLFLYAALQEPRKYEIRNEEEVKERERLERLAQQPKWRRKLLGF